MVRSLFPIPPPSKFRYLEVDVIENKDDCAILVGLIEAKDLLPETMQDVDQFKPANGLLLNGNDGTMWYSKL